MVRDTTLPRPCNLFPPPEISLKCRGIARDSGRDREVELAQVGDLQDENGPFWKGVQGSGFRVQGSGFRVAGSGFRV